MLMPSNDAREEPLVNSILDRLRRCRNVLNVWLAQRGYAVTELLLQPAALDDVLTLSSGSVVVGFPYLRPEARGLLVLGA